MCGGSSDGGASALRQQQQQQQQRIDRGMGLINSIFSGGTVGVNPAQQFSPTGSYFTLQGTPWTFDPNSSDYRAWLSSQPNMRIDVPRSNGRAQGVGDSPRGPGIPEQAPVASRENEQNYGDYLVSKGMLFKNTQTNPGFTPDFYRNVTDSYINFEMPLLSTQFNQANKALQYKLGNQGLLRSSAGNTLNDALSRQMSLKKIDIANQGVQKSQDLQAAVGQERQNITNQLIASANPAMAASSAAAAAGRLSAPQVFAPIGNLFNDFASMYLANNMTGSNNPAYSPYYNPNVYRPPTGMSLPTASYVN